MKLSKQEAINANTYLLLKAHQLMSEAERMTKANESPSRAFALRSLAVSCKEVVEMIQEDHK